MIKTLGKVTLASVLAAVVLGMPFGACAQDQSKPANPATPGTTEPKGRATQIRGKLGEIDKTAKTFTIEETSGVKHVFQVSSETKFYKNDNNEMKPSTLEEGVVGQPVTGSYAKSDDGKMTARNVYWGGRPSKKKKQDSTDSTPAPK
jgi:hypothetical protein